MKAAYVPFEALNAEVVNGLAASTELAGKGYYKLVETLAAGEHKIFVLQGEKTDVYFAVSVLERGGERALSLDGLWVQDPGLGVNWKSWLEFLSRLGKSWGCTHVETAVHEVRQLRGLLRGGCSIESVAVRLEIE